MPRFARLSGRRFDVLGFVTVEGGLFALLLALFEGQAWRWDSYRILGLITFSVLSLALLVVIELEVDDPLLDIRIFRYWTFTRSPLLIKVTMVTLFVVLFHIPLFLQQAQGLGAFDAGLTMLPEALTMAALMPIAWLAYDRIGPRWLAAIGLTIVAIIHYLLHTITLDTSREHLIWLLMGQGTGLGLAMMPIFTSGLAVLPVADVNTGSAFNNVVQRVAGALGLAALTTMLTTQQAQQIAGRAALLPADTTTPHFGGPPAPGWLGGYATYRMTQLQVLVGAIDDLFLITAALSVLGALGALLLRSGSALTAPVDFPTPAQQDAPLAAANGEVALGSRLTPAPTVITKDNNGSVQPADKPIDVQIDARQRKR